MTWTQQSPGPKFAHPDARVKRNTNKVPLLNRAHVTTIAIAGGLDRYRMPMTMHLLRAVLADSVACQVDLVLSWSALANWTGHALAVIWTGRVVPQSGTGRVVRRMPGCEAA